METLLLKPLARRALRILARDFGSLAVAFAILFFGGATVALIAKFNATLDKSDVMRQRVISVVEPAYPPKCVQFPGLTIDEPADLVGLKFIFPDGSVKMIRGTLDRDVVGCSDEHFAVTVEDK